MPLERRLDFAGLSIALVLLLLNALALLQLLAVLGCLLLASPADTLAVVGFVPLPERSGIDLNDGGLGEGVGTDEFVVGRVEGGGNDADLARDTLATPGEVAGVDTETTEFAVTTASADEMDALGADTGVGGLTALLESSIARSEDVRRSKQSGYAYLFLR